MKLGLCTRTCSPGTDYFVEGREYIVDENDPLVKRCFVFTEEASEVVTVEHTPKPKRARKQ